MKINDYIAGTAAGAYTGATEKAAKEQTVNQQEAQKKETGGMDTVRLSDRSREIARSQDAINNSPDIRADKVAEIKAKLDAGTYEVKAGRVADAMLRQSIDEIV